MDNAQVQEIWYKGQRVARTALQAVVGLLPTLIAVLAVAADYISGEWVGLAMAFSVSLQAALSRIMAIPVVDAWLSANTSFGSVPKAVANYTE